LLGLAVGDGVAAKYSPTVLVQLIVELGYYPFGLYSEICAGRHYTAVVISLRENPWFDGLATTLVEGHRCSQKA
jgi:hypothetical protein